MMGYIWLGVVALALAWAGGRPLWREKAWKALIAFGLLLAAGTAAGAAMVAGLPALPFSYWLMRLFEPLSRWVFGPSTLP